MKKYMFFFIIGILLLPLESGYSYHDVEMDGVHVYRCCIEIGYELSSIERHLNVVQDVKPVERNVAFKPHHIWQKTYEVLIKINILREKLNIPIISVSSWQPAKAIDMIFVYEQVERILMELKFIKRRLGITETTAFNQKDDFSMKTPNDIFTTLDVISARMDLLNGEQFTPANVFSEGMRILEDVTTILDKLNIIDNTIPPKKNKDALPRDTFATAYELMKVVQTIQGMAGVETTDFYAFKARESINPKDVFEMTLMVVAEHLRVPYFHNTLQKVS
ncbi:MAG: hypothetical protein L3V56_13945 [Candidatus Magnetoovum sp. WYHC-5]|nr:hypothetical protein [Candidatus Magnetoovum sp. WYHC-5]